MSAVVRGHVPEPPADLLAAMRVRHPDGELIGIDRVLPKSFAPAEGRNGLLGRVRAEFRNAFGETETVEAVATVAAYNMVSRFL